MATKKSDEINERYSHACIDKDENKPKAQGKPGTIWFQAYLVNQY